MNIKIVNESGIFGVEVRWKDGVVMGLNPLNENAEYLLDLSCETPELVVKNFNLICENHSHLMMRQRLCDLNGVADVIVDSSLMEIISLGSNNIHCVANAKEGVNV